MIRLVSVASFSQQTSSAGTLLPLSSSFTPRSTQLLGVYIETAPIILQWRIIWQLIPQKHKSFIPLGYSSNDMLQKAVLQLQCVLCYYAGAFIEFIEESTMFQNHSLTSIGYKYGQEHTVLPMERYDCNYLVKLDYWQFILYCAIMHVTHN